ncbi:hypothetical protein D8X55_01785 [Malacoplasma penetrans]|uniref:Uncharacterized protein n=1 Tax=Malacoplasma penetrans (strain HF-2) TaxID=272633 RepID=Q8EWR2_MALP2|nr:hypothetical protein [Malacoplasma penetrans]RXY97005.1 hypothetical protein D8X55_01785 [Malacoplasma penetrans]BAC43932.1 hypothetical protein [Malacoplasma penetrans HF-2]
MKVKVNRNNTNWLSQLGITSIVGGFILFMGIVIFALSLAYTASPDKAASGIGLNLIAFYYSLMVAIIQVFSSVYLWLNFYYWFIAYQKSINNRKKYNMLFLTIIFPLLIIVSLDTAIRLVYSVAGLMEVGRYYDGTLSLAAIDFSKPGAIFGSFSGESSALSFGNFGFNVVFLILGYAGIMGVSLYFFYDQKKKFISEEKENSNKELRANYRSIEMSKIKKKLSKQKTKDLSKRIKAF